MKRSRQIKIRQLLKKLRSDDWSNVFEAGTELNRSDNVPVKPLISVLENFDNPYNREYAAYALIGPLGELERKIFRRHRRRAFARRVYENDIREKIGQIIKSLIKVIDSDEASKVRGQALETLGRSPTGANQHFKLRARIEKSVIAALSNDSPEVRFWACYAAGELKIKRALPKLRELAATDNQDWGDWWYISEEAADAIEWIHGRDTEWRIPVAQRNQKFDETGLS